MFSLQDQIFRPPTGNDPSFEDVSRNVNAYFEDLGTVFDDNFEVRTGMEAEAQEMVKRAENLVEMVSGEQWAWPHYDHITPKVIEAIEQRLDASLSRFTHDTLGLKHTGPLRKARKQYADGVARAFMDFHKTPPTENDDRDLWPIFAMRAKVLLSPMTPDMGLYPLPTKKTLSVIPKMISPYQTGLNEVSTFAVKDHTDYRQNAHYRCPR